MKQRKTILCSMLSVLLMTLALVTFSAGQVFAAWGEETLVEDATLINNPKSEIAVGSGGWLHVVYVVDESGVQQLKYQYNYGMGWVSAIDVPGATASSSYGSDFTFSLAVDSSNNPHVTWYDGSAIKHGTSSNYGANWTTETVVSDTFIVAIGFSHLTPLHDFAIDTSTDFLNVACVAEDTGGADHILLLLLVDPVDGWQLYTPSLTGAEVGEITLDAKAGNVALVYTTHTYEYNPMALQLQYHSTLRHYDLRNGGSSTLGSIYSFTGYYNFASSLALDSSGNSHISSRDPITEYTILYYVNSQAAPDTFIESDVFTVPLSNNPYLLERTDIAVDQNDFPHILYGHFYDSSGFVLRHAFNAGGGWVNEDASVYLDLNGFEPTPSLSLWESSADTVDAHISYLSPLNTTDVHLAHSSHTYSLIDADNDGFTDDFDCDDTDPSINPGQTEITGNGIDDDCNPATSDFADADGDGFAADVDCEDQTDGADGILGTDDDGANIYPGAPETPDDGIDQDCNGIDARTCYVDSDWDNHGSSVTTVALDGLCDMDESESNVNDDCDDNDPTVYPGAEEICDGKDNDCSMVPDDIFTAGTFDVDGDEISDCVDNCPQVFNLAQADNDGDLVGDLCDPDDDNDTLPDSGDTCPFSFDPGNLDSDGDGIGNVCDNCPGDSNNDQLDENNNGIGDVCETVDDLGLLAPKIKDTDTTEETDTDSDGIFNNMDNCPNIANDDQSDNDQDGSGDVCDDDDDNDLISDSDEIACGSDPQNASSTCEVCDRVNNDLDDLTDEGFDLDGDGYTICQNDCNDNDLNVHPGVTETCNGKDDDCDPTTLDCGYGIIVKEIAYTKDGNSFTSSYEEWLPEAGITYEIEFQAIGQSGPLDPQPTITLAEKAGSINKLPGAYTNDPCADQANDCFDEVTPDIVFTDIGNNKVQVKPNDYAGSVIITAQITDPDVIIKDIEFPKDADDNGLPDGWESQYNVSLGSGSDDFDNDGLTNFEEYRGIIWGPELVRVEADQPDTAPDSSIPYHFQTAAYMPKTGSGNDLFRPDPTKKDLFVKYTGYDVASYDGASYSLDYSSQCAGRCPFALGEAFKLAGVDVHAVSLDISADYTPSEYNIQSLTLTNNLTGGYYDIYNTYKVDIRSWNIATFGFSGVGATDPATNLFVYGSNTRTYNKAITAYFKDKPYKDADPAVYPSNGGMLDPLTGVEDANDNAQNDKIGKDYEAGCADCSLDGDIMGLPLTDKDAEGFIPYDLTTMDIDNDGRVELPRIMDLTLISAEKADSNESTDEFTFEQVLKHIVTHEIGHSVGMSHNSNIDCVMYEISVNWSRDNHFSSTAIEQMTISNQ